MRIGNNGVVDVIEIAEKMIDASGLVQLRNRQMSEHWSEKL